MRSSERSLVGRVTWTTGAAAAAAGIATLLVVVLVADQLERAEQHQDALSLARAIGREVRDEQLRAPEELAAEVHEFSHGEEHIAIVGPGGARLAGDAALPPPETSPCGVAAEGEWYVCRADAGAGREIFVGASRAALTAHRAPLVIAGLSALVVALLLSVLLGRWVGRWSLAPLSQLAASLRGLESADPSVRPPLELTRLQEVDQIALALDGLLGRLATELARSRRFAADAAHELRTPLTKLRAELELSAEALPPGSELAEELVRAVERSTELSALIDRLLLLASPGEAVLGTSLSSLAVVLERALEDLSESSAARVRLTLTGDGLVRGDEAVLRVVVANALDNALKYSSGEVRARLEDDEDEVVLRVEDDGPGLPSELRARVFEPFFRAAQERPGHGVGLALIAHVVSAHGGSARFVGEGPGARLEIRLPRHGGAAPR